MEAGYTPPTVAGGGAATVYAYNLSKQLTSVTRPDGNRVSLTYDSGGRLSSIDSVAGVISIRVPNAAKATSLGSTTTFAYDVTTGQLTNLFNSGGINLSYGYNGLVQMSESLTSTAHPGVGGIVSITLDASLQVASRSVNGAVAAFSYDADDLLTQAGDIFLTRDAASGRLTGTALGSITTARTHNAFGEPASLAAADTGVAAFATQYSRDKLGRIVQKLETVSGVTHTYHYAYLNGRLVRVDEDGVTVESYGYDANGNRLGGTLDAQDRQLWPQPQRRSNLQNRRHGHHAL